MEDLVPVIMFFATPIIIVWLWLGFTSKKEQAKIRLIEKALDLNMDITPELLLKPKKDAVAINRRLLLSGIILASLGLALFTVLFILTDISYASLALLALLPGLGFLIAYWLIAKDLKRGK